MTDEPRGPLASPGFWLHHAALTWRRAVESRLGDITYPQFNVLSAVSWLTAPGGTGPTQQEAADFARSDRMMTSKLVGALVAQGYLLRRADSSDARLRRLELTPKGRTAVRVAIDAAKLADQEMFGDDSSLRDALRQLAERSWTAKRPPT
jgi:DNA-binding MarR family transcriptional regulator